MKQAQHVEHALSKGIWGMPLPQENYNFRLNLVATRGGWMRFKRYLNILLLITFFCLVFHVTLNSRNTIDPILI